MIRPDRVLPWTTPGVDLGGDGGALHFDEDPSTSHFNVVDADGNIASVTQTRSDWGVKTPVGDTGMFLHNGIRLLSTDPEHPMYAGLSGKRLQKSMAPVIVMDDRGRPVMSVGAAGVRQITQAIVQVMVNHLDFGMDPHAAIDAPRVSYENRGEQLSVSSSRWRWSAPGRPSTQASWPATWPTRRASVDQYPAERTGWRSARRPR
jgi:gamma-glutamyltranspeptidase